MAYSKTTWVDDDGSGTTGTEFTAARMNNIESGIETLDTIEAVTAPSFATGWANYGAPYSNAGYYKDRGRVYLRGAVKNSGSGTGLIFTLPSGYRPPATCQFSVPVFGGHGYVTVASDGTVTDAVFSAGSKAITVLDVVSFRV